METRDVRYVLSLEKTIQNDHHFLKETVEDFRELCLMVAPGKNVPSGIVIDIRETYKEIQNRLTEIKAIQQLLQGKYRQYYHRNPLRDKEILEWGFIAKTSYSKFEYNLKLIDEKRKRREKGPASKVASLEGVFQWFHSRKNRVTLLRNLRILNDLDYETPSDLEVGERREVVQNRLRSFTLFIISGDVKSLDNLQSRIQLREHDIIERYGRDELRGVLTHLKEIDPLEAEKVLQPFVESEGFPRLKCLLLPVHSLQDLEEDVSNLIKKTLEGMAEGEMKTLSI
jgi:hypothetical protein